MSGWLEQLTKEEKFMVESTVQGMAPLFAFAPKVPEGAVDTTGKTAEEVEKLNFDFLMSQEVTSKAGETNTATGAYYKLAQPDSRFFQLEPVHILAYSPEAMAYDSFSSTGIWRRRTANMDSASYVKEKIRNWTNDDLDQEDVWIVFNIAAYPEDWKFEMYHSEVFAEVMPTGQGLDPDENIKLYPEDATRDQRRLREMKIGEVQLGMAINIQEHYRQTEIAAKAAVMLYRANASDLAGTMRRMASASDPLPVSYNAFRENSCYGLWGKWYDDANGFHRGIDITFGSGVNIYSICSGIVRENVVDTLTYFTVELEEPDSYSGLYYLTYMHANFDQTLSVGDHVSLGQKIGTESNHMAGTNPPYHTHIELNLGLVQDRYVQTRNLSSNPTDTYGNSNGLRSCSPYGFLTSCFEEFWTSFTQGY